MVLLSAPLVASVVLLSEDGWGINRANVWVWVRVTGPLRLERVITPEVFSVLANVALFVPYFAALAVLVPRRWWILVGALASVAVELHQSTLPGREASVSDVLANSAGALFGVALGIGVHHRLRSDAGFSPPATSEPTTPDGAPRYPGRGPAGGRDGRD